jgi:hypothetical protein
MTKKAISAVVLGIILCALPSEVISGTYSAYVRYLRGVAVTADIDIGEMSDPSAEAEELVQQRMQIDKSLTAKDNDRFQSLVDHFVRSDHPYKRCLGYIRYDDGHPWERVEDMWASEMTVKGVVIPILSLQPTKQLSIISRPKRVRLALYLSKKAPYSLRDTILPLQFAASHLGTNSLMFLLPSEMPDRNHLQSSDHHFRIYEFLAWARNNRPVLMSTASGEPPGDIRDIQSYLWAHALLNALDGRPVEPAVLDLLKTKGSRHTAQIFAGLVRDQQWPAVRLALGDNDWVGACDQ